MAFDDLSTVKFAAALQEARDYVYETLWPGVQITRLDGTELDRVWGVDLKIQTEGFSATIQEKIRNHRYLVDCRYQLEPPDPDFTAEIRNGDGSPGEWIYCGAQLYFYGWADPTGSTISQFVIYSVPNLKLLVAQAGGIHAVGRLLQNSTHGRAHFYAVSTARLWPAAVAYGDRNGVYRLSIGDSAWY